MAKNNLNIKLLDIANFKNREELISSLGALIEMFTLLSKNDRDRATEHKKVVSALRAILKSMR